MVKDLPPSPWPDPTYDYGRNLQFGPPGTMWIFDYGDVVDRLTMPGISLLAEQLMARWLTEQCKDTPPKGPAEWTVPNPGTPVPDIERWTGMRWLHVTINGKLGTDETLSHTMNFRTSPAADVDQDQAAVQLFANQVRDTWTDWFKNYSAPGGGPMAALLGNHLAYEDVTAAYLEQTAPARVETAPSKKTGHPVKEFIYPRPTYLVPTQYAPFDNTVRGTSTSGKLPYEVACCVSLKTGVRGPRNRGRLYLGGLVQENLGPDGAFAGGFPGLVATLTGELVHRLNTGTGARLHVVSRAYATSIGINGVQVGFVPDSQRRRRRSLKENAGAVIPT